MEIAEDEVTGKKYTTLDFMDQAVLVPYKTDTREIYFLGKFSENGNWDGNCIINIYDDHKLSLITDAVYNDGELIRYRQAFAGTGEVWYVSSRTQHGNASSGETWTYSYLDFNQLFTYDTVNNKDMWTVNAFEDWIRLYRLNTIGYYNGDIENGYYNDTGGKAYMVKYFDNGDVQTLYMGNFQDGYFNDNTGNAVMIGKKDVNQAEYSICRGVFENGSPTEEAEWSVASKELITDTLKDRNILCSLQGLI